MPTPIADAVLMGVTALGMGLGDKVTVNAGIYDLRSNVTLSRTFQAGPGGNLPINVLMKATGDQGGSSIVMMQREIIEGEGPNNFADLRNRYAGANFSGIGRTALMYTDHNYISVTGGGNVGTGRVHYGHFVVSNGSRVESANVYEAGDLILRDGFVQVSRGLRVDNIGHPQNVQQAFGVQIANFNASQLAVGVEINTLAGPGKAAIRATGDAPVLFRGATRIGSLIPPQYPLDVTGDVQATGVYRFANGVILASGPGMPSYAAARGSVYLSTDFGLVLNTDGGMGWTRK